MLRRKSNILVISSIQLNSQMAKNSSSAENHKHAVITEEWIKLMFDPRCSVVKEGRHSVCHWLFKGEKGRRIYSKCCSPKHKALRGYILSKATI